LPHLAQRCRKILHFHAHPDDPELGCGGTIALYSKGNFCRRNLRVADDDRTTVFAISSMLKEAGYAVTA